MILTQQQVNAAHAYGNKVADDYWYVGGTMIGDEGRRRLFATVIVRFQEAVAANPTTKPDSKTIVGLVKNDAELKGFIPFALLLGPLISWIIGKLLDYLWGQYTQQ